MRTEKAALICGALAASGAVFLLSMGVFAPLAGQIVLPAGSQALPSWTHWVGAVLLGFGLAWTTVEIRAFSLKIVIAVVALLETALLSRILHLFDILWTPYTTLAAGILGTAFGLIYSWSGPGRRRQTLESLFGGRISQATLRRWLDSDEPLPLGGAQREATILVCRIFNRGEWAGALSAEENIAFSTGLLKAGSKWLKDAGALIVESDGEHWVAAFGAVLPEPDHASKACQAALNFRDQLSVFDIACRAKWKVGLDFGIAVNSGAVSVGASGNQFLVTGASVDFCRKLCQATREYGARLLVGPETFRLSWDTVEVRPVELIWDSKALVPEEIYELLSPKGGLTVEERARRELFWKGVILYRRKRWRQAAALFEIVLRDSPAGDRLAVFYRDRALRGGGDEGALLR